MSELVDMVRTLSPSEFGRQDPGDPEKLAQVEQRFSVQLPLDYRDLMIFSDGCSFSGPKLEINLEDMSGLIAQNYDEWYKKELPGMFIIGDDGAGGLFFYDPINKLGKGNYGLFSVKMGVLGFDYSVFVAATLTEAFRLVRAGAQFRKPA